MVKQGRHRYFRLARPQIAELLESMMILSADHIHPMKQTGPRDAKMRKARICYDHLAGESGVMMFSNLLADDCLKADDHMESVQLTAKGVSRLTSFGINVHALSAHKRTLCRSCLDWSERRPHLAGAVGAALWQEIEKRKWARRVHNSRIVEFTPEGERQFYQIFAK